MQTKKPQTELDPIVRKAVEVLEIEAAGIMNLIERLDHRFVEMVDTICSSGSRVIISGIGKSGIIGRKIVATLNSTGTRSLFLHPVEAMHGDLGQVCPEDIFIALSKSGETDELNILLPSIRRIGCKIIAFTGANDSNLARLSDIVIDVGVDGEACPLGLAPTASTTALLAMGDALAVVLLDRKQFKPSDFRMFHPGGTLGQRLAAQIKDLMISNETVPVVLEGTPMTDAIAVIDRGGLGATIVVDHRSNLKGIVTDGDIRRMVVSGGPTADLTVDTVMTANPRSLTEDAPTYDALNLMEQHQITVLPIVDSTGKVEGIIHLHDILGKGEFKFHFQS